MKIVINKENRTFEAYVNSIGCGMGEVSFYEVVRPTWKILRTNVLPFHSASFFVSDFLSIVHAVQTCLDNRLAIEAKEKENMKKWQKFLTKA